MTERKPNTILDNPKTEKSDHSPSRQPGSPHHWDFEFGFASDPYAHSRHGRIRASSWDDSDDNLPPVPENSGSKTCRIYSSDDKKYESSSEINELKKEFFKNLEKENEMEESPILESLGEMEMKLGFDRRLSPARIRRRSKSSGSSSPVRESDCQISSTKMSPEAEFQTEIQEINPNSLEYDPKYYLANFFTELRSRRISMLDSMSELENLAKEEQRSDGESTPMYEPNMDEEDPEYFCKTTRKLSKILEVEENKNDLGKSSDENISESSMLFQKNFQKPEGDFSPLQTARSKKSEKVLDEKHTETAKKEEKNFRSFSSEYLINFQKPQKLSRGSLTDRSARFFDQKLDDDFISLSAKSGKTELAARKYLDDKQSKGFSPRTPNTDKNCSDDQKIEDNSDLLKLLKIDLTKTLLSEDTTPRRSTDRSEKCLTTRTKSGKSRKSWNPESPKFIINVGRDSGRSLKVEDVNPADFQTQDKEKSQEDELSFRKSGSWVSENSSEAKTERIPHKLIESPSGESEISVQRSFQELRTNSSRSSRRKKRKQKNDNLNVELDTIEVSPARCVESITQNSPALTSRSSEKPHKTSSRSKCSAGSTYLVETEHSPVLSSRSIETLQKTSFRSKYSAENICPVETTKQYSPILSSRSIGTPQKDSFRSKCSVGSTSSRQVQTTEQHSPTSSSRSTETQHKDSCQSKRSVGSTSSRLEETTQQHSPILNFRSIETPHKTSCRSKCSPRSAHLEEKTQQQSSKFSSRSIETPHKTSCRSKLSEESQEISDTCVFVQTPGSKSSRTSKSPKVSTPKTTESRHSDHLSHRGTPRINKSPELNLPLDIYERPESQKASHRSTYLTKDEIEVTKDSGRPESRRKSRRRSERSSSSRTRNTECSPRSPKITPRTNSGSSKRSKDSLESRDEPGNSENFQSSSWKELEKVCDTISNHTSVSSARSSDREMGIPSRQHSYRSEINNPELDNSVTMETFEANNPLKERLSGSRHSSRTSTDSNITESLDNNSPDRTTKIKSRPNSSTSKEFVPPDVEKLDINPVSGRTQRSFIQEEDEDEEESPSTHRSKIGDESDRFSNKRLSVINEVSFEDLETSNSPIEKDQYKSYSERNSHRIPPQTPESYRSVKITTPKDTSNASGWILREKLSIDDESIEPDKDEDWTQLIRGFDKCEISNTNFPGFKRNNETSWSSMKDTILEENNLAHWDEISENLARVGSKVPEQNFVSLDTSMAGEKDLENPNLVYQTPLTDKVKHDYTPSFQNHQNIHYVNVDKTGLFGIGEFGDVTCWDPGDFGIKDTEKPKDHGDGIPSPQTTENLLRKSEKTEKNVKQFTDSTPILDKLLQEAHIPCRLKVSKSDICNSGKVSEESEYHVRAVSSFLNDFNHKPESFTKNVRTNREVESSNNTINKHSSSDSLESARDLEFDSARTPRLSRSLSNLDTRLQESLSHREPSLTLSTSESELFKNITDNCKTGRDSPNLNVFLHTGGKISPKSRNWLTLKNGIKAKRALRKKGAISSKHPFHDNLSSRKIRPSVPNLKLRHPNCFQNFYKRVISVFCLTSNSSAATSQ